MLVRFFPRFLQILVLVLFIQVSHVSLGALEIDIVEGQEGGLPIAIVPFEWRGSGLPPHVVSDIVESDLVTSGQFDSLSRQDFLSTPHDDTQVRFKDWRLLKAEALVVGKVQQLAADIFQVQFQLFDVFKGGQLAAFRWQAKGRELRSISHQISDIVYEELTGERGAFDTQIAYVTEQKTGEKKNNYLLRIADSDGFGPQTVLRSRESIMSPAWSPDGQRLAYVSFESGSSVVWVQNKIDGSRRKIAEFKGINSAPAWSPDGGRLALTLSRDGNAEIYIMDMNNGSLRRLTNNPSIDTEAAWAPDGRSLVFTSGRSGKPQIYRISASGGRPERLTFEGKYNARASFSSDGKRLALVTNQGNGYRVGVFYIQSKSLQELTNSRLDESPSFAPNGRMILYGTQKAGRGVLAAVSDDGRVKQLLKFQKGDVREPAWSPFKRK